MEYCDAINQFFAQLAVFSIDLDRRKIQQNYRAIGVIVAIQKLGMLRFL
jgi:hypothetical protein